MKSTQSITRTNTKTTVRYTDEMGRYHRLDGPAYLYSDISKTPKSSMVYFKIHGNFYRENGPALINTIDRGYGASFDSFAFLVGSGRRHRLNGPASVSKSDTHIELKYYKDGLLHRRSGPAIIYFNYELDTVHFKYAYKGEELKDENQLIDIIKMREKKVGFDFELEIEIAEEELKNYIKEKEQWLKAEQLTR